MGVWMRFPVFLRVAVLAMIGGAMALIFVVSKDDPKIAEKEFRTCIEKSDYSCVTKTLNKYPPDPLPTNYKKDISITLALLGETDWAIDFFQRESDPLTRKSIAGAILAYLTAFERKDRLLSFRSQLTSHDIHLSALSFAESKLENSPKHFRDETYSAYTDYIEYNLFGIGSENTWNGIMGNMAWRDLTRLISISSKIPNAKLREYVKNNTSKYYQPGVLKHRNKVTALADSTALNDLEKLILTRLKNPEKRKGAQNRNYQLFYYYLYSISWIENLAEQEKLETANKFTNTVLAALDPLGEKSCISGLYGLVASFYGRVGNRKLAIEYLDAGKKHTPVLPSELSNDGECFQGHYAYLSGLRGALGDQAGFSRFIADMGTFPADFVSYLHTGFKVHGACHTDSKIRRYVLDYIVELRRRSGNLSASPLLDVMETAFRFGDVRLAMSYAQSAVSFADSLENEDNRRLVMEQIKSKIIGREFSIGWLYHHKIASC